MSLRHWRKPGKILSVDGKRGYFNLAYGSDSTSQKLDVWLPEKGDGPFPVILSIHGGGFTWGDKGQSDCVEPMLEGLNRGYAVVGIEYRLNNEAIFPYPVRDIKQAIKYLRANAQQLSLDDKNMIAWGGSAGGYMALMACLFEKNEYFDKEQDKNNCVSAAIRAGVSWYPITDFSTLDKQLRINSVINKFLRTESPDQNEDEYEPTDPPTQDDEFPFHNDESVCTTFVGSSINELSEQVKKANPMSYIHTAMPKLLLQHGSGDEIIPMQQSIEFALAANDLCGEERVILEIIPHAIHSSLLLETKENINRIFKFIDGVIV
ncbi:alpha/beta hydrolase fold domain-containing protein [Paenibacillus sp. LMG 31458]|uniref:Alpha/beta hydrolase fold domain-containing protein n=1 Tax=Paenibacillus phytorum TaxID=2654977 RepID=A0ABX1XR95_9BACL|nr:alpha/beta hydrolase [Paenibacillus phytorum]NOU70343.1 alpha/beta hydrolase fold domain-containing protein [Paenibacillus phytorum]